MTQTLHSYKLKSLIKEFVIDLGLTLTLRDAHGDVSLRENEAVLAQVAQLSGVTMQTADDNGEFSVTFSRN